MTESITVDACVIVAILLLVLCNASAAQGAGVRAEPRAIAIQSEYPPLQFAGAPAGGAHPVGGPALRFVNTANRLFAMRNISMQLHVSGEIHPADDGTVEPSVVVLGNEFRTLYEATAAGSSNGGLDAAISIAISNGHPFGELLVAGLPFGMPPDEFLAYLYAGGGLALEQELYDEKFDDSLVVLPIAVTAAQSAGWFPSPLPDPAAVPNLTDEQAMAQLCRRPWIVRWPQPATTVWQAACKSVGVESQFIGEKTRCDNSARQCPGPKNPVTTNVSSLTFGGFVPGGLPHSLVLTNNIDAYELNLPLTDVFMMKMALGLTMQANDTADLTPIVAKAPYLYAGAWHQPLSYIEVIFNRTYWDAMGEAEQAIIETAAKASTLENLAASIHAQHEGLKILEANGAVVLRWPDGLLRVLRRSFGQVLDMKAAELAGDGDDSYRRVVNHMRQYISALEKYSDFGDVNHGRADIPTSP